MAPRTSLMNSGSMMEDSVMAGSSEMLEPVEREQPRLPEADAHRLAAAEGREPAEPDGEDGDQNDAGEEHGHRDAEHAEPEDQPSRRKERGSTAQ